MIKINHTLQILDISGNPICDEGIAAIARSLGNAKISKFYVCDCKITVTGAKSLAAGLKNNHSIKLLSMCKNIRYADTLNNITVDGAIAILEAAVANGVCQEVIIYDHKSDDKMKELMSVLEERKRQEVRSIIIT